VPAEAAQVTWRAGPCPIGEDTVRVFSKVSENTLGGWDADTASYSANGQWRTHKVSTCGENLFSMYGDELPGFQPDPELVKRLTRALETARREVADPANPQVWERYRIAARMYAEIGRTSLFMGDLWLEASWTVRDSGIGYYEGLQGPETTRGLLDRGATELAKGLDPGQEKSVRFNLARVAYRGGYTSERDAHLAAFKAAGPMTPREEQAVSKMEVAARMEAFYQQEALRHFRAAMADTTLTPAEKARATYLVGELSRRLGDLDGARKHLTDALAEPALVPKLADAGRFLLGELGAQ
jgi:hypothetical protein